MTRVINPRSVASLTTKPIRFTTLRLPAHTMHYLVVHNSAHRSTSWLAGATSVWQLRDGSGGGDGGGEGFVNRLVRERANGGDARYGPDLNEEPPVEYSYGTIDLNAEPNADFGFDSQASYVFVYDDSKQSNPEEGYEEKPAASNVNWETKEEFMSDEALVGWVKSRALDNGYIVVKRRTKKSKTTGSVIKFWLMCDRGGEHNSIAILRRSGNKKIGCPFQLIGLYNEVRESWKLQVINDNHNHERAQNLEGHPYVRRFTQEEEYLVENLTERHIDPRNILSSIKKHNPANVLENVLHSQRYVYYTREDPETNVVEDVFFCHPKSYCWWRAFPHILMMDATYKTNQYRLPFIQIVSVTSTHQTFSIAHAFVSKEREENYVWVLEMAKSMLNKCMEPHVIITDRDLAVMSTCRKVFPEVAKYLYRWHIDENIAKHCKASFSDADWKKFKGRWTNLCNSPTTELYDYNYNSLGSGVSDTHLVKQLQRYVCNSMDQQNAQLWSTHNKPVGKSALKPKTIPQINKQHACLACRFRK
ncbi:hypothetical protein E3N88_29815 [Mikania micrantha]|uniref:MULE transposase domain-containing protein n=1 Tax=Mikania micrantha TaxID=192012 RepID=A0A5N6MKL9_9ASTR|nr:hypothetical protein E3N88_29815 [Mikania micrantha]